MEIKRHMLCKKVIQTCLTAGLVLFVVLYAGAATGTEAAGDVLDDFASDAEAMNIISEPDKPDSVEREEVADLHLATEQELSSESPSDIDQVEDVGDMAETNQMEDWQKAYLDYLDSLEYKDRFTYSFIYVDDDVIPELEINTGGSAGGSLLLTYHDGILDEVDIYRSGLYYIEKCNLVCNSSGNYGYYYDYVYTVQDGRWKQIGCGEYREDYESRTENSVDYIYEWEGKTVTEEEYGQMLQNIYPKEESGTPEGHYYIYKDISSLLKTGTVASANHHYELLEADMTWTEAEAACRKKGGYLAAITSWEEFERIQEQIIQEEKTEIAFWIGAMYRRERRGFGFHCLEPGEDLGYDMLSLFRALWYGFWWEKYPDDEPSYDGLTESGEKVKEGFVMMRYSSDEGRCYYWDMPDDILAARPSFAGKIGYICEYDGFSSLDGE